MSQEAFVQAEIDKFIKNVSEHCDSIRVFVSMPDDADSTESVTVGYGNWYSQYGLVTAWLLEHNTRISNRAWRKEDNKQNEGEGPE